MMGVWTLSAAALLCVWASAAGAETSQAQALLQAFRTASGGAAWDGVMGLRLEGDYEAGGSPGTFSDVVDHKRGFYRRLVKTGPIDDLSGFDGAPWVSQNGIDLPALVADANTHAYQMRDGWWDIDGQAVVGMQPPQERDARSFDIVTITPKAGSAIDLWLDAKTHLIDRTVAHVDGGDVTMLFSDWRVVNGVRLAFRREEIDADGDHTVFQARSAKVLTAPLGPADLHRPKPERRGALSGETASAHFRFDATDHGHIVVPVEVERRAVELIFDTGAANYFTANTASRLGLVTSGGVNLAGVSGGGEHGGFAKASRICIGAACLRDEAVIVGPLPFVATHPRAGMDVGGLTGFEFLAEFRTTIDYEARTLQFSPFGATPSDGGVTVPFFSDEHNIYAEAEIDGVKGLFRLDTGDGGGVTVFRPFADRHGLFMTGGRSKLDAGGLGGALKITDFTGGRLTLAEITFDDLPVSVADARSGSFASKSLAGNLGAAVLGRFRITFDYHARTLTLRPIQGVVRAFGKDNTGLSVTQTTADQFDVLSVDPTGPAFSAGLRAGDAIVEFNGASVARDKLGVFDLHPLLSGEKPIEMSVKRQGFFQRIILTPMSF